MKDHNSPENKKEYVKEIGKKLTSKLGVKKYYNPEEVEKAHRNSKWAKLTHPFWAISIFSSHEDFDRFNQKQGRSIDYTEVKFEMLEGISDVVETNWMSLVNDNIDGSWLDLEGIFDGLLEGIGELISGIFDGI